MSLDQALTLNAYTLFARVILTVWTSAIWEDFWIMRLVRMGPVVQLCLREEVAPTTHFLSMIVVLAIEKGSRVQLCPLAAIGPVTLPRSPAWLCPWAKLVRATAAWISLQPWSSRLCWPRSCCWSLWKYERNSCMRWNITSPLAWVNLGKKQPAGAVLEIRSLHGYLLLTKSQNN